jgi:hypothetical protein
MNPLNPMYPGGGGGGGGNNGLGAPPMNLPAMNEFNSADIVSGSKSFLDSNSYVAKAAFLILTVLIFVYVLRVCISLIGWLFSPNSSPYLVDGLIDGTSGNLTIPQDPSQPNAITILRSTNDAAGIAFTWSAWIYIKQNDATNESTGYHHVFNKGSANPINNDPAMKGIMAPNNGPGLYLKSDYSGIRVVMSTFEKSNTYVDVDNIPINKWFNVIIRVENTILDVFMNGDLAQRLQLDAVPFQNYGDVNVAKNHGFNGLISSLRYYNTALGTRAISNIISAGPNLKVIGSSGGAPGVMDYLSMRWFYSQWNAADY